VYLVFDSDVMTKASVHAALARLKEFLESRGAEVFIVYLPPGPDGAKVGLDDYLASGHGADGLLALAEPTLRPLPEVKVEKPAAYFVNDDGMFWLKPLADGDVPSQLSNFAARIVAEVVEDDGVETRMSFRVEAKLGGKCVVSQILAGKFPLMNWPLEILGHAGVVFPGFGTKDHLRVAIQILSHDVERVTVYTYLGWRQLDGRYVFFHAGGAIGQEGLIESIQVKLPESLGLFRFPKPFEGEDLRHAADAALRLFDLAPPRIMAPLLGATFRVLLGDGDFTLHLAGRSGMFKSELASLLQRFFGAAMDRLHLPLAWSATDNSIEATAFVAKDVILTIDDLALVGNSHQISQLFAKVDRVIRAQGNRSARQRLRADASLQSQKPPRGVILSTGEDVPRGLSVRARLFVLEVAMGDVDATKLAACQSDASAGHYVGLMSAFIRWLAPRMDVLRRGLRAEIDRLRNIAYRSGQHRRTPELVASVAVGWECLLAFLHSMGCLPMEEVWIRWQAAWTAIGEAAESQRKYQAAAEPANRFLEMVQAVISSSAGHLAGPHGEEPEGCRKWGWRWNGKREEAKGQLIGWIRGDDVYLEPDAAYAGVQRLAREQGDALGVSLEMLSRLLHERGLLASVEKGRNGEIRYKVRVSIAGGRRRALHFKAASLLPPETPVHPGQTQDPAASQAGLHWTGSGTGEDGSPGQAPGQGAPSFWLLLPLGPVGPASGGGGPVPPASREEGSPSAGPTPPPPADEFSARPATGPSYLTSDPAVFKKDARGRDSAEVPLFDPPGREPGEDGDEAPPNPGTHGRVRF